MRKFKYLVFLFSSHSLFALTTLNVTLNSDNNPGGFGEAGDLRYCLNTMNQNLNTIPDDYAITFDTPMTIQLNGILPIINNSSNSVSITIGNSDSIVTIDGNNGSYRGFFIPMGNVTIQNMTFQNLSAKGGTGGNGISGGGGGLGAGGAIYAPQYFLNGSYPDITLINVSINNCSAVGGNGGSYLGLSSTGNEGGGGGGGFSGNGGSVTTTGSTGGGGGGGFGGDGGNVTQSTDEFSGGGGGGGGGLGSRATIGILANLGNGGADQNDGSSGNGYGLNISAGQGGGGNSGGTNAGGGGGGNLVDSGQSGGGGGGSSGTDGMTPQGSIPPGGGIVPSGGNGGDGGGGGGGGIVITSITNFVDGHAGSGGYGAGGGGGAGTGASDNAYTVQGGSGGFGGGGGGGGVNQSGTTSSDGGNSLGGGGGGGGGPSSGVIASGGLDVGSLGGGSGGNGTDQVGTGFGGGGGGGGSGIGAAIFVDSNLNFSLQALAGIPTTFNTSNNTTQAGIGGLGGGGNNGLDGSALANSIFLRSGSSLSFIANDVNDLLTLGEQVSFTDDYIFGLGGTNIFVRGNGTVVYNGTSDYEGMILINNANFKVNGVIDHAPILVCRNSSFSSQRGALSGKGTLTGSVYVNSGIISPDAGEVLTLGSLILNQAHLDQDVLGSLVHIKIDSNGTHSSVVINGPASLAGTLEIDLDPNTPAGAYNILTSTEITDQFDVVTFTNKTPSNYTVKNLPAGNPTYVQFAFTEDPPPPPPVLLPPSNLQGLQKKNDFAFQYEFYNLLTWSSSSSPSIVGYNIYRDGKFIARVDASTRTFEDHNRKKGISYVYAITAFNAAGQESSPIEIVITSNARGR